MEKSYENIWEQCLFEIKQNINTQTFSTWFMPIVPLKLEEQNLTVQIPNKFFYEWIEEHYSELINSTLQHIIGPEGKLKYFIPIDTEQPANNITFRPRQSFTRTADTITQLNNRYTFDNFVEGPNNQFARASSYAVANSPGNTPYNPLFIYGGSGLGKTHLIQAIGNFAIQKKSAKKVLYASSEKFTYDFINAIQKNNKSEFSNMYRNVDLLLIDDIHFFINKEQTQEEFFHTFNTLYQNGKQIILTSDRPPKELKGLAERLVSRFQWGLTVDIQPPDLETRIAILQKRAEEENANLEKDVTVFLAHHFVSNIRELEGALIRLMAYSSLHNKTISMDIAKVILKDFIIMDKKPVTIEGILRTVAKYYSIPEDLLRHKTRRKEVVTARHIAMFLCKEITNHSYKTIGLHFGRRDHSSVIHAVQSVNEMIVCQEDFQETLDALKQRLEYEAA